MVTDQQVRRLMMLKNTEDTKAIVAAKAGMDEKTARKYINLNKLPSEINKPHNWPTHEDIFRDDWPGILDLLKNNPGLESKSIFEYFQKEKPGKYQDGQLRTLQRRIKIWRAISGPAREVFFSQIHHPGELCASDFTHMTELGITIQGIPFEHLLYHFTLTYSNWEAGTICFSESFESLCIGLQNALWELGGVPKKHRTDRLSAAVNKECNPEKFTENYQALLRHYGIEGQRTNACSANENGDIEQRNGNLKRVINQALLLRGSRDFGSHEDYKGFLVKIFKQLNSGREKHFREELKLLNPLPMNKHEHCKEYDVRVGPSSTIHIQHNTYSVHSRLIGEQVVVRVHADELEIKYGQKTVEKIPRLHGEGKCRINYRHIIEWLVRKPGAFENYKYKPELFPSSNFRIAYDYLKEQNIIPARESSDLGGNGEYVKILNLAFKEGEQKTEDVLRKLIRNNIPISSKEVEKELGEDPKTFLVTNVNIDEVNPVIYDELLDFAMRESSDLGGEVVAHG